MRAHSTLIGSIGVGLLLLAFVFNLLGWVGRRDRLYIALNLAGGSLACWASYLIDYPPFVILEGTWAAVAAVALVRSMGGARSGSTQPSA